MFQRNEIVSYALDFVSYLILKVKGIDRIILHGSVARGDFDEKSDVDLFVDSREKIGKKVERAVENYYKTKKFKEWELKGVDFSFSCVVGKLDSKQWVGLKRGIVNTGIVLYGKYKSDMEKTNSYVLFSFEGIKPDKKRIAVFRKLFGFKVGKKRYEGMVGKMGAVRVGKGCLLVPAQFANELKEYFQGKKVSVRLFDLWSDGEIV